MGPSGPSAASDAQGARPLVALSVASYAPVSQTFIYAQVAQYRRYEPEVFARRRENADRFPEGRVCALKPGGPVRHLEALIQSVTGFSPTFLDRLRSGRHRLLHAQFGREGLLALPLQAALGIPLLVTFRGRDVGRVAGAGGRSNPWLTARRRRLFRTASRILAVSRDIAIRLVEMGAPADRVQVWRVGIDIPPGAFPVRARGVGPTSDPFRVLMAGRFVEKKGFEYGLEAFARFVACGHDARLTLAGGGGLRRPYERLVRRLGIGDRVDLTGELVHQAVLDRIASSDVVIVPSVTAWRDDREGVPNVLKEALVRAVPVIGTRHGGIPDAVVDGETGLLVPERDADALVRALRTLAEEPALRARLGAAGRQKMAREFDVGRQVAELEDLYDEVLAGDDR